MKTFISAILLLMSIVCNAQNFDSTSFYANSNFVYGSLNKTKITTGLLREYGIDFTSPDDYTGKILNDSKPKALQKITLRT